MRYVVEVTEYGSGDPHEWLVYDDTEPSCYYQRQNGDMYAINYRDPEVWFHRFLENEIARFGVGNVYEEQD